MKYADILKQIYGEEINIPDKFYDDPERTEFIIHSFLSIIHRNRDAKAYKKFLIFKNIIKNLSTKSFSSKSEEIQITSLQKLYDHIAEQDKKFMENVVSLEKEIIDRLYKENNSESYNNTQENKGNEKKAWWEV